MQQELTQEGSNGEVQSKYRPRSRASARPGLGLALFSVGLGLAELFAPAGVAGLIGLPNSSRSRLVLRALGARELLSGVGLLIRPNSPRWLWSRVGGDAMDLALLGDCLTSKRATRTRLIAASAAVVGVTAIDALSAARRTRSLSREKIAEGIHVRRTITINRAPSEVYEFWREFQNLPKFMAHLESVEEANGVSTWTAKGPAGTSFSWQAEVVSDRPGVCIAWRSVDGSTSVPNRGTVNFAPAPGNRGTEVRVELDYEPPGGAVGAAFAKLFGEEPGQQIQSDLRRLKQVLETGEVLYSDASLHRGMHPGRPSKSDAKALKGAAE